MIHRLKTQPSGRRLRRWLALALLLIAVGATGACGKKNPPELPEGQTDRYPRQYPNPEDL